ncbi:hypothetical protein ACSBR2_035344 [Camellia fascicularis]
MEEGGWKPVIRKHGGARSMHQRSESSIYTVLLTTYQSQWNPKGCILCSPTSEWPSMAVQKANGLWCDNRALKVKATEFVRRKEAQKRPLHLPTQRQDMRGAGQVSWKIKGKESYAHVVSGKGSITSANLTLKVYEVGNGWLYNCAIVRLKSLCCGVDFEKKLRTRGMKDIEVRDGGGRDIVLSFQLVERMREKLKKMGVWIKEWSELITEWKQGMAIEQERAVWLSCYGVPLNLWNKNTFHAIGRLWGEVIGLDDDTSNMKNLICGKVKIGTK